jgi:hypothetical protein
LEVFVGNKRKSRYLQSVISFAVSERARGLLWREIRSEIGKYFRIAPPSERAMRDWVRQAGVPSRPRPVRMLPSVDMDKLAGAYLDAHWSGGRLNETLLMGVLVEGLRLSQQALHRGQDPEVAAGAEILRRMAEISGDEKVQKMIREYEAMQVARELALKDKGSSEKLRV